MKYTVTVRVSECQEDTFEITAPDLETAQRDAMEKAIDMEYDIEDVIDVVETEEEIADRKSEVEKAAKAFLHKQIIEKCGGTCDNPEDYISEFTWVGNSLYAGIEGLENARIIATLEKGVVV